MGGGGRDRCAGPIWRLLGHPLECDKLWTEMPHQGPGNLYLPSPHRAVWTSLPHCLCLPAHRLFHPLPFAWNALPHEVSQLANLLGRRHPGTGIWSQIFWVGVSSAAQEHFCVN